MAKIWKVAHLKMETFSVKVVMITIIVMTTAKMYWVMQWAKHPTWIILLNSHKSFMWLVYGCPYFTHVIIQVPRD